MNDVPSPKPMEWTEERVGRYWDYCQQFPETYFTYDHGVGIVDLLGKDLNKNEDMLDYGAGRGFLTKALLAAGYRVTAADFSRASVVSLAATFSGEPNFGGALTLEEILDQGKSFSTILMTEVIEHLDDERLEDTFNIIGKILKPGGLLIISTPNDENLQDRTIYCPCCNQTFHRWQHLRCWDRFTLGGWLEKKGFVVRRVFETRVRRRMRRRERVMQFVKQKWGAIFGMPRKQPHLIVLATLKGAMV
ncbi:MAG: class I SAM-dependent methyltransferase [Magnetococcales bacterium]|nr:class I SAM-dependent methyltransferase [Magnetococcales bacterium]